MLYVQSLNQSLHKILANDKSVILMGEDLLDPYGGAFKVSKGLSTSFPAQVISTPISEAGIVGSAVGMAMRGLKPIVEIMFGDFLALASDQIVNHASKYSWMYNHKVTVPLLIRMPVGGRRGYGPTHSQSLESMFMPISGIDIIAPSLCHNPGQMLETIIGRINKPTIFIEYKTDYAKNLCIDQIENFCIIRDNEEENQNISLAMYPNEQADILIVTYGGNTSIAVEAAKKIFMENEIIINILVLSCVRPIDEKWLISKIKMCGKIIVLEEGNKIGGWGSEIVSIIQEKAFDKLKRPIHRIGAMDIPIPSSGPMENEILPSVQNIMDTVNLLMGE